MYSSEDREQMVLAGSDIGLRLSPHNKLDNRPVVLFRDRGFTSAAWGFLFALRAVDVQALHRQSGRLFSCD